MAARSAAYGGRHRTSPDCRAARDHQGYLVILSASDWSMDLPQNFLKRKKARIAPGFCEFRRSVDQPRRASTDSAPAPKAARTRRPPVIARFFCSTEAASGRRSRDVRSAVAASGEERQHDRGDAGLVADEDGKAAEQLDRPTTTAVTVGSGRPMCRTSRPCAEMAVSLPKPARMNMSGEQDAADEDRRPRRWWTMPGWPAVKELMDMIESPVAGLMSTPS